MKFNKEIWAIIPARSGSKDIKNKNIMNLKGKPLIAYSINAAKKSKKISKIIFSSDSKKYYDIAKKYGKLIFHKRPASISGDKSTDFEFFDHFVKNYKEILPEYFVHLRPTTPYRDPKIIDQIIEKFLIKKKFFTSLRSLSPISNIIFKSVTIKKKKIYSPLFNTFKLDIINSSRQSYDEAYIPNGYIDIIKTENIFKNFLHGNKVMPMIIKKFIHDIDNLKDFKKAQKNSKYFEI
jgi:CMP-N,N'-diacetyllegionaminic acid synthase